MKVIISPAMNMKENGQHNITTTEPVFKHKANFLVTLLKKYDPFELESILGINYKLSESTFLHYQNFNINKKDIGYPALLYFDGLAYKNIKSNDFSKDDFDFANKQLRMLSALYGILKPTDLIQPYRLDFMCKFAKQSFIDIDNNYNDNLYSYWHNDVYSELYKNDNVVLNLCSVEYEKVVKKMLRPCDKFITCKFLVNKDGKFKSIGTYAKMARGKMVKYIIKNRITNIDDLKNFNEDGFKFSKETKDTLIFIKN